MSFVQTVVLVVLIRSPKRKKQIEPVQEYGNKWHACPGSDQEEEDEEEGGRTLRLWGGGLEEEEGCRQRHGD